LSNAIRFTGSGGSVLLAVHRGDHRDVIFEVRDTGCGMTAAEVEIALEPFGQVEADFDRKHEGTGLGLPLARRLTELHGGSLSIASVKGEGTTVSVVLPAAAPAAPQRQRASRAVERPSGPAVIASRGVGEGLPVSP